MEEKKKLKIGLGELIIILLVIILAVGVMIGILYIKNKSDLEITKRDEEIRKLQSELKTQVADNSANEAKNTVTNTSSVSTQETTNTIKSNTAVDEIKKSLKDESWLKNNIYITEDEQIVKGNLSDQVINFCVCKSSDSPIVVLEVSSDNSLYKKAVLVTYTNGVVKAEKIIQGHISHGGYEVDPNKCVTRTSYMHMGANSTELNSIADGYVKFIGRYSTEEDYKNGNLAVKYYINRSAAMNTGNIEVTKSEYDSFKASLNESQYNFVEISTKLTNANVDAYVK